MVPVARLLRSKSARLERPPGTARYSVVPGAESPYEPAWNSWSRSWIRLVSDDLALRAVDTSLLARFVEFLSSMTFMEFARQLTGVDDIEWISAQATCYRPGHFFEHFSAVAGTCRERCVRVRAESQVFGCRGAHGAITARTRNRSQK